MRFTNPVKSVAALDLSQGNVVADFGSGSGVLSIQIAHRIGTTGTVYSIDIQKELVETLHTNALESGLSNIEVIWGNVEEDGGSKLNDEFVDAVVCSNLLFQVEEKDGVLKEAHRILKHGGKLLIVDWVGSFGNLGPTEDMVFNETDARQYAKDAGFNFQKEVPAKEYHYGLVFTKE